LSLSVPRKTLLSGSVKPFQKFERVRPDRGREMRERQKKIGDFQRISRRISETVRDRANVTIGNQEVQYAVSIGPEIDDLG